MPQISPLSWLLILFNLLFLISVILSSINNFNVSCPSSININNNENNINW